MVLTFILYLIPCCHLAFCPMWILLLLLTLSLEFFQGNDHEQCGLEKRFIKIIDVMKARKHYSPWSVTHIKVYTVQSILLRTRLYFIEIWVHFASRGASKGYIATLLHILKDSWIQSYTVRSMKLDTYAMHSAIMFSSNTTKVWD